MSDNTITIQKTPIGLWVAIIILVAIISIGGYKAVTVSKERKIEIEQLLKREVQADSLLDAFRASNRSLSDSMAVYATKSKLSSIATKQRVHVKKSEYKVKMGEIRDSNPSTYDTWLFLNGAVNKGMEFDSIAPYH